MVVFNERGIIDQTQFAQRLSQTFQQNLRIQILQLGLQPVEKKNLLVMQLRGSDGSMQLEKRNRVFGLETKFTALLFLFRVLRFPRLLLRSHFRFENVTPRLRGEYALVV